VGWLLAERGAAGRRNPLLAGAVALAALAYLVTVDPNQPGHYPPCLIRATTGWYCPGCGGLRSVHALMHGDLRTALHDNVAIWVAIPVLALTVVQWRRGRWTQRRVTTVGVATFVVLLGFAVVRNLPGFEALRPL
jgi:Protein of unknown function (DUF2752)